MPFLPFLLGRSWDSRFRNLPPVLSTSQSQCRKFTPRSRNGMTHPCGDGRANPTAAQLPRFQVANRLTRITPPTVSMAPAHLSRPRGPFAAPRGPFGLIDLAPKPLRYAWVSSRPVPATTLCPSSARIETAMLPTPPTYRSQALHLHRQGRPWSLRP